MNDEPFDEEFMDGVKSITRSTVHFHVIPKEHWSYPDWVNQTHAAEERQKMVDENVICEHFLFPLFEELSRFMLADSILELSRRWKWKLSTHVQVSILLFLFLLALGDLIPNHSLHRFNSGFFFQQSVLQQFDWYWRVEPVSKTSSPFFPRRFAGTNNFILPVISATTGSRGMSLYRVFER